MYCLFIITLVSRDIPIFVKEHLSNTWEVRVDSTVYECSEQSLTECGYNTRCSAQCSIVGTVRAQPDLFRISTAHIGVVISNVKGHKSERKLSQRLSGSEAEKSKVGCPHGHLSIIVRVSKCIETSV